MPTHESQSVGFQAPTAAPKAAFAVRPFEVTSPGQGTASPTNPFPRRPREVWMGESAANAAEKQGQETDAAGVDFDWSRISLYAEGQTSPEPPQWPRVQAKLALGRPDELYEQEADHLAEQGIKPSVSLTNAQETPLAQRQPEPVVPPVQRQPDFSRVDWFSHAPQRRAVTHPLQAKLTIGQPKDPYEQEADRVAEQVMSMAPPATPTIQRQPETHKESEEIQPKLLVETITPIVQRQAASEDEEPIQAKCEACEAEEPEEPIQRAADGAAQAQPDFEQRLNTSKGSGSPLPQAVRNFMEPRFGTDFSQVRVHTGGEAIQMNKEVNAKAFTHGQDIYFGAGKSFGKDSLTAHELTHIVQQSHIPSKVQRDDAQDESAISEASETHKVAFVREEGLNLREAADQKSTSLTKLKFGQRVHALTDSNPQAGWQKVAVLGQIGYVSAARIHFPPEQLIQKDPGLSLIKVKPGETFWSLVKNTYGIQGNESTKDQNINHFINAIRAVNKPEAFKIKTDALDDVGNFFISGRDATDTYLIAGVDLWIPSFGVAAKMDVGSGTVRGEITRFVKKIEQKIEDFRKACSFAKQFIPDAIIQHVGSTGIGLLKGLVEFAKEAAIILATSTAVGALIGSLFGGVGAIPGAEIGFEVGLLILEIYGLYMLVEAIMSIAGNLISRLGQFIQLVWTANGDEKQLEQAGQTLADALGILASSILVVLAAYLLKKGSSAFSKTKFAKTIGEKPLMEWLKDRQQFKTSKDVLKGNQSAVKSPDKPKTQDQELSSQGYRPKPGERSMTREQWRLQGRDRGYKATSREPNLLGKDKAKPSYTQQLTEWRRSIQRANIAAERRLFLGENYVKVGPGKWRSLDGTRQFRATPADYLGEHGIGQPTVPNTPHIHLEFLQKSGNKFKVIKNIHIPLK